MDLQTLLVTGAFITVAVAARHLSTFFAKFHLPLITGLLFIGILSGPFAFDLIRIDDWSRLNFVNELSLAYIAFAASAELYLKEMRSRLKSIKWMTIGQLVVTFVLSSVGVYFLVDFMSFTSGFTMESKLALSILTGTIFVARSPASAMGIIKEMRAKGPFTQTSLGVTVLKDFLVIVLFAVCLSFSRALVNGDSIDVVFFIILALEIGASFGIGILIGKILEQILRLRMSLPYKGIMIILLGFSVYKFNNGLHFVSDTYLGFHFGVEPLIICIVGSFWITNYTRYRLEFTKILNDLSIYIYVPFFTLAGLSLEIEILLQYAGLTFLLFMIRLISIMVGSYFGGTMAGEPPLFNRIGWMPYVTQAGVGLGLTTIVASTFPSWGANYSTLIISVIVVNQVVGPPLFKWAIRLVKEGHQRATTPSFDGIRDAFIFGLESQSVALANQLKDNGWHVKVITLKMDADTSNYPGITIEKVQKLDLQTLESLDMKIAEAAVCLLTDKENLEIANLLYEHFGTKDVIVRLNHRYNLEKFHELGALIVDPSTAIVSLLDHLVRSPQAASLLLGMDDDQDSIDVEVQNRNLHGLLLRDLRMPSDTIILAIHRGGHTIISHGYTRLRIGDHVTVVGSKDSLELVAVKFGRY